MKTYDVPNLNVELTLLESKRDWEKWMREHTVIETEPAAFPVLARHWVDNEGFCCADYLTPQQIQSAVVTLTEGAAALWSCFAAQQIVAADATRG